MFFAVKDEETIQSAKTRPGADCRSGIAEERKDVKSKGEGKRYTQLNAEFPGTPRRDRKAFLNG